MRVSTLSGALLLAAAPVIFARPQGSPPDDALYKDPTAPIDDRVADLLGRMNLEEKIGQLMQGELSSDQPLCVA